MLACLALAAVLIALQVASSWYWIGYASRRGAAIGAGAGCLCVYWWDPARWRGNPKGRIGWDGGVSPRAAAIVWWGHSGGSEIYVPFWWAAAGAGALAGWLWFPGRGRPADRRCETCSYDLRGNTTGVCPECGKAVST